MVAWIMWGLAVLLVCQRLIELHIAKRNFRRVKAAGAIEYGAGHYPLFFMVHGAWLAGWLVEAGVLHPFPSITPYWPVWGFLFAAAQALRYWCIHSLGMYWNTRILIIPGAAAIKKGPYQYVRHPNYIAVAVELFVIPAMFGAWVTVVAATAANALLLLSIRIPREREALQLLSNH